MRTTILNTLLLTLAVVSTTACTQIERPNQSQESPSDYIGLSAVEAQALAETNGVPFRITKEDGEGLPTTHDYHPGRINAIVENREVVSYTVEREEIIPPTCTNYFDGCNTCFRDEGSDIAACTERFCHNYEEPHCLDKES
jgi:hypothetical protein